VCRAGAQNVRVLSTELAEHPAGIWANWNIHTGLWLRHCKRCLFSLKVSLRVKGLHSPRFEGFFEG
jgi:hypothetical protein